MKRARKPVAVTLALIGAALLLSALTGAVSEPDGVCICSTCAECEARLSDPACAVVTLTAGIVNQSGTCTNNPENFPDKIFDCQYHTIDGDNTGVDFGILLEGQSGNTIRNCIICEFSEGIDPRTSSCDGSAGTLCGCVGASHTFLEGKTVTESCTLNCDLTSNGTCFTIGVNNITLDGGGHRISGNGTGAGIEVSGEIGVTITGITIANFKNGIHLVNSQHCTVINSTVTNSSGMGIGRGIFLDDSSHNIITDNRVQANDFQGMYLEGSSDNVITNNTANSNGNYGIVLWSGSNNNIVMNNTASDNNRGITLGYAMANLVSNNTLRDNTQFGIELQQSSNTNTFYNNTIIDNGEIGISIGLFGTSYQDNAILMNTIEHHNYGISLLNAANTTIAGNTVTETTTGIMLEQ